ncbi:putative glutaredoxin [Chiua virens]|nr:putative glutaredoxin [Chiua virens]
MTTIKDIVEDKIAKNKIVVFSKSYCPHCRGTKQYFAAKYPEETVEVVELDLRDDGSDIQEYLGKKTGARSVPRTFISGEFIGGNDALQGKPKSEVDALIAKGI